LYGKNLENPVLLMIYLDKYSSTYGDRMIIVPIPQAKEDRNRRRDDLMVMKASHKYTRVNKI
jgi:hypothetical protein